MKKKLVALIALIMSVFMTVACMSGCNLVTSDSERDMNQVIATVSIDDGVKTEIKKKEAIIVYLNYGYIYTQYYGYTQSKTFNLIIDGLIEEEILLQNAMKEIDEGKEPFDGNGLVNENYAKWDVKRYLTEDEIISAVYDARKGMNDLLDSYDESKTDKTKSDTLTETVRTVPTDATNKEKELTVADKKEYNDKAFDLSSSKERRSAFNSVIKLFKNNGLLGSEYDGTIESTDYYKNFVQSRLEAEVTAKYQSAYNLYERKKITFEMLKNAYSEKLEEQKNWSNAEFVQALSDASASSPMLYSAYGNYGYVYNLLLGVNSEQEEAIGKIDSALSKTEKVAERRTILDSTTAKDLRSSWIISGYDFDGVRFTGDYTFAKDSANALPFKGSVTDLTPEDTTDNKFSVDSVNTYSLDEFIGLINDYVYGGADKDLANKTSSGEVYYSLNGSGIAYSEYDAKIQDLLFAFSTDPGSLNTYKGYAIKPAVDGSNTEEYVESFAKAGRELISSGQNSYTVVATDYGYHFMFYSQLLNADYGYENLVAYLNALSGKTETEEYWTAELNNMINGWDDYEDTDSYLYLLMSEMSSTRVSKAYTEKQTNVINQYTYEKKSIERFEKTYSDLVAE